MYLLREREREVSTIQIFENSVENGDLVFLWEMEIWSYRAISTVPIVFSTFLENSPPFPSSLKLLCAKFKKIRR